MAYRTRITYRDGASAHTDEHATEGAALRDAREECKWENCARVVVVDPNGQTVFDELGDFNTEGT